jgi:hypothetical protein
MTCLEDFEQFLNPKELPTNPFTEVDGFAI